MAEAHTICVGLQISNRLLPIVLLICIVPCRLQQVGQPWNGIPHIKQAVKRVSQLRIPILMMMES